MEKIKIEINIGTYKKKKKGCAGKVDVIFDEKTDNGVSYWLTSKGIENEGIYDLILNLTDAAKNYIRDEMKKEKV